MRRTINKSFAIEGIGLHKGEKSLFLFKPQEKPLGIRFFIEDSIIPASISNLHSTIRGTNLSDGKNTVYTVEHLLSAITAFSIDDLDIEVHGIEPPAMDGSALPFARMLYESGFRIKNQDPKKTFTTLEKKDFSFKNSFYSFEPSDKFELVCVFENPHPMIGSQEFSFELKPELYIEQVAPARTFGFEEEISQLKESGLALGGSLDNAIVLSRDGILNSGGLRYKDEFVRHKMLDLIGDLSLTGFKFEKIKITGIRTSHQANAAFASFICGGMDEKKIYTNQDIK